MTSRALNPVATALAARLTARCEGEGLDWTSSGRVQTRREGKSRRTRGCPGARGSDKNGRVVGAMSASESVWSSMGGEGEGEALTAWLLQAPRPC